MGFADDALPGRAAAPAAVERAWRDERGAVLATLIRHVGDFQLAEDAVQDAFAAALQTWKDIPANPAGWLYRVCRNKALPVTDLPDDF